MFCIKILDTDKVVGKKVIRLAYGEANSILIKNQACIFSYPSKALLMTYSRVPINKS